MSSSDDKSSDVAPRHPRLVTARGSGSLAVLGMTTPSRTTQNWIDLAMTGLLELADNPPDTPQRQQPTTPTVPAQQEEELEDQLRDDIPEGESEDEGEDANVDCTLQEFDHVMESLAVDADEELPSGGSNRALRGAPEERTPPGALEDWTPDDQKLTRGEPDILLKEIDNLEVGVDSGISPNLASTSSLSAIASPRA